MGRHICHCDTMGHNAFKCVGVSSQAYYARRYILIFSIMFNYGYPEISFVAEGHYLLALDGVGIVRKFRRLRSVAA